MKSQSRINRSKRRFGQVLGTREPLPPRWWGIMGDGGGTVKVDGKRNTVYVRIEGRTVTEALNFTVPARDGLRVVVGKKHENPTIFQVLGVDWEGMPRPLNYTYVPSHHESHELQNPYGGDDVVWVQKSQLVNMLVYPSSPLALTLEVSDGWYLYGTGWHYFDDQTTANLGGYRPVNVNMGVFVLISIDGATENLQYTAGVEFLQAFPPDMETMVPTPPAGSVPLAAIYLVSTTATINWNIIYDLRILAGSGYGTVTPTIHRLVGAQHYDDVMEVGEVVVATGTGTYGWAHLLAEYVEIEEIGDATFDDLQDWLNNTQSAGYLEGGETTAHGPPDGTVDVAAVTGFLKTTDDEIGVTPSFDLAGANLALTDNRTNYIYVNFVAGPVWAVTVDRSTIELNRQFDVAWVYREGNDTHILQCGIRLPNHLRRSHERLMALHAFEQSDGGIIAETGNRFIESTNGVFYHGLNRHTTTGEDTSGADTFRRWYHAGGVWSSDLKSQICAAAYQYDDGNNLANFTKYGVFWVYIHFDSDLHVVVGRDDYTLAEAQAAEVPPLPEMVRDFGVLAARIIIKFNGVNFTAVQSAYDQVFLPSGSIDHNDLGSLQGGAADEYYHLVDPTQGDLAYGTGAGWAELAIGVTGTYLRSNGVDPLWAAGEGGGGPIANHLHAGVAGDGGQISHDNALVDVSTDDHHAQDHKDRHDPEDGVDPLDAAAAGTIQADDAAAEGTAHSFSRSDHQHEILTVTPEDTGVANDEGTAYTFVRSDHVHKLHDHDHTGDAGDGNQISHDTALTGISTDDHHAISHKDRHDAQDGADALDTEAPVDTGVANAVGASHNFVRGDHVHKLHDHAHAGVAGDGDTIDHGALTGRGDDDHTIYILVDGTRAFSGVVSGVSPTIDAHLCTRLYTLTQIVNYIGLHAINADIHHFQTHTLASHTNRDHHDLVGLLDDDHTQYVLHSDFPPGCRVYSNVANVIGTSAATLLDFTTEISDTDTCWAAGANSDKLYAKTAGYYMAGIAITWDANATGRRTVSIVDEDGDVLAQQINFGGATAIQMSVVTGMQYMAVNDYVTFSVWQNSGGNLNVRAASVAQQHFCTGWLMRVA